MSVEDEKELYENPKVMIETAQNLGNELAYFNSSSLIKIHRELSKVIQTTENTNYDQSIHHILMLKPKFAYVLGTSFPKERGVLARFISIISNWIDFLLDSPEEDKKTILKAIKDFTFSTYSFFEYSKQFGARPVSSLVDNKNQNSRLQMRIDNLEAELLKLTQFVSLSKEVSKVFLSHSSADKPFVEKLKNDLEKEGIATWYDNKDINIGDIISEAISEGIKQSWYFLIVVSQNSVDSKWVKYELDEAYHEHIASGKKVLPILIGDIHDDEVPTRLRKHRYGDFRIDDRYEDEFKKLCKAILLQSSKSVLPENN